ncbi:hypothetical protein F2Q69_00043173 [Brassica cretica]|uniref:Uncharacterized protein n=1 Tax=Brassica cretica TaxID=69181 RepID=A0A8S9NDM2_BRACR|nr:hypothetical protein F2Q69_00043173 [Brassica cretica]
MRRKYAIHPSVGMRRYAIHPCMVRIAVASCYESWIINSSGGRLWLRVWNGIVVDMGVYECQAQLTWKSTGTRALPICTSRSLTIPPELL